jgi:methylamine dehydrogenase heavy chain
MRPSPLALTLAILASPAAAQEFQPETLTVKEAIDPGPNVFVANQSWDGASTVNVLSADDLSRKGNLAVGLTVQFVTSADAKTGYATSVYMKRYTYGPVEAVLQEFDIPTLSVKREIVIPNKMAQVASTKSFLRLSADEKYAFVQNATPATSVTVVDLAAGKPIAEVPTPGCFSIYPAASGIAFSTLCGDGTVQKFTVAADGTFSAPATSEKIFDADSDPLFVQAERVGDNLVFVSFTGNVYTLADAGEKVTLVDKHSFVEGVDGGWRPGGVEIMAYNGTHDVLFLTMHPDGKEGSHKDAGKEVWAYRVADKELLSRSEVEDTTSIAVTGGTEPVLFALNDEEGAMVRYEVDPEADFEATAAGKVEELGDFAPLVLAGE